MGFASEIIPPVKGFLHHLVMHCGSGEEDHRVGTLTPLPCGFGDAGAREWHPGLMPCGLESKKKRMAPWLNAQWFGEQEKRMAPWLDAQWFGDAGAQEWHPGCAQL